MAEPVHVAVLIDCENISPKLAGAILAETTKHGTVTVKRAYGDWSSANLTGWRQELPIYAIQPVQQFGYVAGKNSSDAALIVDAMDLLYSNNVDVFCIVSGDSDFTRLVTRMRESGRKVYGIGGRNTHESFVNSFDRFTFTEVLGGAGLISTAEEAHGASAHPSDDSPSEPETSVPHAGSDRPAPLPEVSEVVTNAVRASLKDDGWAPLATVGWYIVNNIPSFDSRNYGFPKLGALMRSLPDVEVREVPDAHGAMHLQVRLRKVESAGSAQGK